jgi:hypothetical protein
MSLSELQIKKMMRLTFEKPYSFSQLSRLINASYREVYDFFRTKKAKELFVFGKPWLEILDTCDLKLSKNKKQFYNKWVQNSEVLVRLSHTGFDLMTARAKVQPAFLSGRAPQNQHQARATRAKKEKLIFRRLNYPQHILLALNAGQLEPSDLPCSKHPGSGKYFLLLENHNRGNDKTGIRGGGSEGEEEPFNLIPGPAVSCVPGAVDPDRDFNPAVSCVPGLPGLPPGWLLSDMMESFREEEEQKNFDAFNFPEEELIDLPYSQDRAIELYSRFCYRKFDPFKFGKCSDERFKAITKLLRANVKNFGFTIDAKNDKGERIFIPNNEEIKEECVELFEEYMNRSSNELLVLMPKNPFSGEPIIKPNANRFNNEEKRTEARIRFENIFNDAGKTYKNAIMLTLTSGQWHNNIFEDVRAFQANFHKLITRLRKEAKDKRIKNLIKKNPGFLKTKIYKNLIEIPEEKRKGSEFSAFHQSRKEQKIHNKMYSEFRNAASDYTKSDNSLKLPYLCVREFQQNGNIHYHIIIFGISWLKNNDEIEKIWKEYGQGTITKTNKIKFNEERGYIWERDSAPKDSKGRQPLEYLKKYLLKGQYGDKYPETSFLYWVFNSRFFTFSSSLLSDEHKPRPYISKNQYEFWGTCGGGFWSYVGDMLVCYEYEPPPGG